jgi:hypothetical protein
MSNDEISSLIEKSPVKLLQKEKEELLEQIKSPKSPFNINLVID